MKKYIPPEELAEIKKIDLFTYLSNYEPNELIRYGRNDYGTKTHSSLHISNGLWTWWAGNIGGRSALDYLIKVENFDFIEAASLIQKCIKHSPPVIKKTMNNKKGYQRFKLPLRAESNINVINYLTQVRHIDKEIVDFYINKKMIYESDNDQAVVFIGYDINNKPKFACKRATDGNWKKDVFGSQKQWNFHLRNASNEVLHIFESPIDLMSYQTLEKLKNRKWKDENYLSLGGATLIGQSIVETEIPVALEYFLKNNPQIHTLVLHLDNDRAGHDTSEKIKYHLTDRYEIINKNPKYYKDINELLINKEIRPIVREYR